MPRTLDFAPLINYDAGLAGITVPVSLSLGETRIDFTAKIDTGSTECVFARRYGEQLGLEIEVGERIRIGMADGGFTAYRHFVTLTIFDENFNAVVCFPEAEGISRSVLGRHGFLDRVILGLIDYEGKLYLSRYQ